MATINHSTDNNTGSMTVYERVKSDEAQTTLRCNKPGCVMPVLPKGLFKMLKNCGNAVQTLHNINKRRVREGRSVFSIPCNKCADILWPPLLAETLVSRAPHKLARMKLE